jgi:hypothetical protein
MTDLIRKLEPSRSARSFLLLLALLFATLEGCAASNGNNRPISPFLGRQGVLLVSDTLFFGLSSARGPVSPTEWENFLRDVVTPRFPDGFTYWEASGQWRGMDNQLVREPAMVLQVIHPDNFQTESAIQEIIARYKGAFEQDSVLRLRDAVQVWY